LIVPKRPILAGVGTEALVAASGASPEEPATAVWRNTANRVNETGDFSGEALPECGA